MRHPRVDELLRDPPPDESDAARRERVQDALGPLDDPAAVLALWDGLVSALVDVIRQRGDHRGYRGSGRLRGHELSDLTLATDLVLAAADALRFERAVAERDRTAGATRRELDEEGRGSRWRTRLLLGGAGACVVTFGALLAFDLSAWLPLAFAGAGVLTSAEIAARVVDKLPKRAGEAMRQRREAQWLSPEEVRRWLESRRDEALREALGADLDAAEVWVERIRVRVSELPRAEADDHEESHEETPEARRDAAEGETLETRGLPTGSGDDADA
jgi:hypothetical protein